MSKKPSPFSLLCQRAKQAQEYIEQSRNSVDLRQQIEEARESPNKFIEFCFTKEDGSFIRQAAHHRQWQALFTENRRTAILGAAELGKTTQLAFRIVFELGNNPELRCHVVSAGIDNSSKILGLTKSAIEGNERVRLVFPDLKPGDKWTNTALLVQNKRRASTNKDYSVQALGYGSRFLGARSDIFVVDDINDSDNVLTKQSRERIISWFDDKVQSRLTKDGKIFVIGNAWHREDLIHTLKKRDGFVFRSYPVIDEVMRSVWPEQFPLSRIAAIRRETTPISFARTRMCQITDEQNSRFDGEWFETAKKKGLDVPYRPKARPQDSRGRDLQIYCAVDLSSGKRARKSKSDLTVLFVIAYDAVKRVYQVLSIQSGIWKAPEIVDRMRSLKTIYDPVFVVEDNSQQQLFVDSRELTGLRVVGHTTDEKKHDPTLGIEGLALSFSKGMWVIPSYQQPNGEIVSMPEVEQWLENLEYFSPISGEHTSDDVMASWIAMIAARTRCNSYFAIKARA